ncbi:MAG TPA: SDR family NAD(P)-dependent oxidoreductase, partial [Catenuloplanes sp.]
MPGVRDRRIVVVTGSSSGIGLAAAVALARSGDEVVLLGR